VSCTSRKGRVSTACESRTNVAVDAAGASVLVVFGRPDGQLCGVRLDSP